MGDVENRKNLRGNFGNNSSPTIGLTLDWSALIPAAIHPIQITILEAMAWLDRPVSSVELRRMFQEPEYYYLSAVSYHMGRLVDLGAVEAVDRESVRGAEKTYYRLVPAITEAHGPLRQEG